MPTTRNILNIKFIRGIKEKYPQLESYDIVDVLKQYHSYILEKITSSRHGVLIPGIIGHMFIGVFKSNGKKGSNKNHDRVALDSLFEDKESCNIHDQDGYECRLMYSTVKQVTRNQPIKFWGFKPSKETRAICTKAFKNNWKMYMQITNVRFMRELYTREIAIYKGRKLAERNLKNHKEFRNIEGDITIDTI